MNIYMIKSSEPLMGEESFLVYVSDKMSKEEVQYRFKMAEKYSLYAQNTEEIERE